MKRAKSGDTQLTLDLESATAAKHRPEKQNAPVYSISERREEKLTTELRKHVGELLKLVKHIK